MSVNGIFPLPLGAKETIEYELGQKVGIEYLRYGLQGLGPETYQPLYDVAMEFVADKAVYGDLPIGPGSGAIYEAPKNPELQQEACERVAAALSILIQGEAS